MYKNTKNENKRDRILFRKNFWTLSYIKKFQFSKILALFFNIFSRYLCSFWSSFQRGSNYDKQIKKNYFAKNCKTMKTNIYPEFVVFLQFATQLIFESEYFYLKT